MKSKNSPYGSIRQQIMSTLRRNIGTVNSFCFDDGKCHYLDCVNQLNNLFLRKLKLVTRTNKPILPSEKTKHL